MTKTILFIALLTISATNLFSQKNSFCLNVGFHGNLPDRLFNSDIPKSNNKNGGVGLHIMPLWNYSNHISYGINSEYSYITTSTIYDVYRKLHIFSVSPTFRYNITDSKIRPFAGTGMGFFHVLNYTPKLNFGIKPFVGVSVYDVFNLSVEYSKILSKINEKPDTFIGFNEYLVAIKCSFTIGLKKTTHSN